MTRLVLTARDHRVISLLAEATHLSTAQLRALAFPDTGPRRAQLRLQQLRKGLANDQGRRIPLLTSRALRQLDGSQLVVWSLGRAGQDLVEGAQPLYRPAARLGADHLDASVRLNALYVELVKRAAPGARRFRWLAGLTATAVLARRLRCPPESLVASPPAAVEYEGGPLVLLESALAVGIEPTALRKRAARAAVLARRHARLVHQPGTDLAVVFLVETAEEQDVVRGAVAAALGATDPAFGGSIRVLQMSQAAALLSRSFGGRASPPVRMLPDEVVRRFCREALRSLHEARGAARSCTGTTRCVVPAYPRDARAISEWLGDAP